MALIVALAACSEGIASTPAADPTATKATHTPTPSIGRQATPPLTTTSPSQGHGPLEGTMTAAGLPESRTGCGGWKGTVRVEDPRMAGTYRSVVCTVDRPDGGIDFWGVWTLWNADGTWDGEFVGDATKTGDHRMDAVLVGSGAYAGLQLSTHSEAGRDDSVWTIRGTVEPVTPTGAVVTPSADPGPGWIKVTGTRSCARAASDPSATVVDGVTQQRGEVDQCGWSTTDSRLTGPDLTLISADLVADGSGKGWGMLAMRTADGLWTGGWSMERRPNGRTTTTFSLRGLLAWDGLVFRGAQVGKGDTGTITGWIAEED